VSVITRDILLVGVRRDEAFDWIGDFSNHRTFLEGAFDCVSEAGEGELVLCFKAGFRCREMGYRFEGADDGHGGRRVKFLTTGKRTQGKISYSLRTMRPSSNTLVTVHMDYDPGGIVGMALNSGIRQSLGDGFGQALINLKGSIS
jgi:hypothetical protein